MDIPRHIFHDHVLLFHYWLLQAKPEYSFLKALLPMIGIVFIIAVGVVLLNQHFQKNLFRQMLEKEEIKNRHHHELLQTSIEVQEKERKRIAQDMHDELGAVLSISKMHLQQMENQEANNTTALLPALQNVRSLLETAISSMRRINHELMPPQLESFGLVKTLEAVAMQASKAKGINIYVIADNELPHLDWKMNLGLYRICMELMNNTLKHAQADTITIKLEPMGKELRCTYTDNGSGLQGMIEGKGLGFKSIEGRANSLGGTVSITKPAKGFEAIIGIPYQ